MPSATLNRLFRFSMIYNWIFQPRGAETEAFLNQRRVFIVPSRHGIIFGMTLIAMLFSSINYDLSLGFVLTFMLSGLGLVAMLFTFRNQAHLRLRAGKAEPVFVGDRAHFSLTLSNAKSHERGAVWLRAFKDGATRKGVLAKEVIGETVCDVPPAARDDSGDNPGQVEVTLSLAATKRGWLDPGRLMIETRYPLGLFRAWSYWHPAVKALVYPKPEAEGTAFPLSPEGSGEGAPAGQGTDDFASLREYQPADSPRHIAWKVAAQQMEVGGTLLTKQFAGQAAREIWLDFAAFPRAMDDELKLSRLTRWALDAEAQGLMYGLKMLSEEIEPSRGEVHLARVLRALALHGEA